MIRLDKFLSQSGEFSRSEAASIIRSGCVRVNGIQERDISRKIDPRDAVTLRGSPVTDDSLQYWILYKPSGILTAARDSHARTVMDLVPPSLSRRKVLPVGRLDKDTTGLLLLTNDGAMAHDLLSPKRHVNKLYVARVSGKLLSAHIQQFATGLDLGDFISLPAELQILKSGEKESLGAITLREGKFHQVKRMFSAIGCEVITLHRQSFGPLELDETMQPGDFRRLTPKEVAALKAAQATAKEEIHGPLLHSQSNQ